MLAMDPFELKLECRAIGIKLNTHKFAICDIKYLRFIPPAYIRAFHTETNPAISKIKFQTKNRMIRFAKGITEREGRALIDRMMEVYKFPKDNEPDSSAVGESL